MSLIFWSGIAITCIGFLGLIYCGFRALSIRKQNKLNPLSKESFSEIIGQLSIINMICLTVSMMGLIILVLGLFIKG